MNAISKRRAATAALGQPEPTKLGVLVAGAAAILTVTAAIIYFAGGLVLAARLWAQQFPMNLVLIQMPRQILQQTAVSWVLVPAAGIALLCFLAPLALLPRKCWLRTKVGGWFEQAPWLSFPVLAVLLLGPGAYLWTQREEDIQGGLKDVPWWLIVLGVVAVTLYAILISYAMPEIMRYRNRNAGSNLWVAMVTLVMILIAVPGAVMVAAGYPLDHVRVCSERYEIDARLIGATSDWLYLGQYFYNDRNEVADRQIVLVPSNSAAVTARELGPNCSVNFGYLGVTPSRIPPTP